MHGPCLAHLAQPQQYLQHSGVVGQQGALRQVSLHYRTACTQLAQGM